MVDNIAFKNCMYTLNPLINDIEKKMKKIITWCLTKSSAINKNHSSFMEFRAKNEEEKKEANINRPKETMCQFICRLS